MGCATDMCNKAVLASSIKNQIHNAFTRFEFTLARLTWNLISFGALCPIGSSFAPHELFVGFATECVGFPSPSSDLTALFLSGFLICNGMHELLLVFVRSSTDAACEPFLAAFRAPVRAGVQRLVSGYQESFRFRWVYGPRVSGVLGY